MTSRAVRKIVLLRGVNVGSRNRISMPELRAALTAAGFEDVHTYLQSGNVLLSSGAAQKQVARACSDEIRVRFGLSIEIVVRTRDELAEIVRRDPLEEVATDPKRYLVTFLAEEPLPEVVRRLADAAARQERVLAVGREVYSWHPEGIGRSRLWALLAGRDLGTTATARNWNTVGKLLELASVAR